MLIRDNLCSKTFAVGGICFPSAKIIINIVRWEFGVYDFHTVFCMIIIQACFGGVRLLGRVVRRV